MQRGLKKGDNEQKRVPRNRFVTEDFSGKTAATYSPTVTQYHRRDRA